MNHRSASLAHHSPGLGGAFALGAAARCGHDISEREAIVALLAPPRSPTKAQSVARAQSPAFELACDAHVLIERQIDEADVDAGGVVLDGEALLPGG